MTSHSIPIYDSAQRGLPFVEEFKELIRYRDLLAQLVVRNIKTRYKRSVFGIAWTMLNPLLTTLILSIVFSELMKSTVSFFPVFLLAGVIFWNFFAQTTLAAMSDLVWGGSLMHHTYVPRAVFAMSALGTGLVNLLLSLPPLFLVMWLVGAPISPSLFFLPVPIVLIAMFALGVGLLLSTLAVYFNDVMEMYQILLSAWYFFTPIMYTMEIIPPERRWLLKFNPLYHLLAVFRTPIYAGDLAKPILLATAALIAVGTLLIGWWVFTSKSDQFAYRI